MPAKLRRWEVRWSLPTTGRDRYLDFEVEGRTIDEPMNWAMANVPSKAVTLSIVLQPPHKEDSK